MIRGGAALLGNRKPNLVVIIVCTYIHVLTKRVIIRPRSVSGQITKSIFGSVVKNNGDRHIRIGLVV